MAVMILALYEAFYFPNKWFCKVFARSNIDIECFNCWCCNHLPLTNDCQLLGQGSRYEQRYCYCWRNLEDLECSSSNWQHLERDLSRLFALCLSQRFSPAGFAFPTYNFGCALMGDIFLDQDLVQNCVS